MARPVYDDELLGKAFDPKLARKMLIFAVPYKKQLGIALVAMLATAGLGLAAPYLMKIAIDDGMAKRDMTVLTVVAALYIAVYIARWFCDYRQRLSVATVGQHVIYDIRHKLFTHLQNLSLSFFDKRAVGRIISRLTHDVDSLNELITSGALSLITDLAMLIGIIVIMINLHPKLALLTFTLMPFVWAVTIIFRGRARVAYRDVRRKVATVTATVAENVSGVRVVKSFSRERENLQRFKRVNLEHRQAYMSAVLIRAVFIPVMGLIAAVGACMVFWYGGLQVIAGSLTVGILWAFILYMERFFQPIRDMSQLYHTMQSAMAGAERIFEILETEPAVRDKSDAMELPPIKGRVEFQNVNFAYEDMPVLKDVSFQVEPGETIALVGPTGAGKTTIINLLGRMYDIQSGAVLIDGHDIRDVTMKSLRSQMGVVLQDPFLFPGSVRENIRYGRLDATDHEVEEAAKTVGAHEFIMELPEGYKTDVREGGTKLSVGQKQLVSFARALLADPKILILDEATASVDAYTEMLIQSALRKLLKGRTSFVIAHRLSTIVEADRILVIEDGRLVESGKHKQLLKRGGLYRKLYDMQFRYEPAVEEQGVPSEA